MNVTLYTFSKKHNSTAVPTGGTSVDVVLKDEAGVLDPIIELHTSASPSAYNYLYIPTFGRYYWLREWTYNRGIWTGSFYVDPLASWKTQIGAQQLYIFRSAAAWDGRVVDMFYPTIADPQVYIEDLIPMFTVSQATPGAAKGQGRYVFGIISDNSVAVEYIALTPSDAEIFCENLFANSYYNSVLGPGSTLTPELKTQINPAQYIVSCRYWPAFFAAPGTDNAIHMLAGSALSGGISVGSGLVNMTGATGTRGVFQTGSTSYENTTFYHDYDISDIVHPQQARGIYLRAAPYTQWEVFYPPFGIIELDSTDMVEATGLRIKLSCDIRSGNGTLDIYALTATDTKLLARATAPVAIESPITGIIQTGSSPVAIGTAVAGAATSLMTGNILGAVKFAENAITSYTAGKIPHLSMSGSVGSSALLVGQPQLLVTFQHVADDDVTGRGRPLCSKRLISSIPGYITADPDELSIAATARELEEIRGFISGGFFYE